VGNPHTRRKLVLEVSSNRADQEFISLIPHFSEQKSRGEIRNLFSTPWISRLEKHDIYLICTNHHNKFKDFYFNSLVYQVSQ